MGGAASGCLLHYCCSVLPARLLVVDQAQRQRSLSRLTGIQPCYSAAGGLSFKYHPHRSCHGDCDPGPPACLKHCTPANPAAYLDYCTYSTKAGADSHSRPRSSLAFALHPTPTATVAHQAAGVPSSHDQRLLDAGTSYRPERRSRLLVVDVPAREAASDRRSLRWSRWHRMGECSAPPRSVRPSASRSRVLTRPDCPCPLRTATTWKTAAGTMATGGASTCTRATR
jgi:hypothetical protein